MAELSAVNRVAEGSSPSHTVVTDVWYLNGRACESIAGMFGSATTWNKCKAYLILEGEGSNPSY